MAVEQKETYFDSSKHLLEQYLKDRLLLLKLQTAEKSARLSGMMASFVVIAFLSFFVLMFISLMAGYFFAGLTGSMFYGFGIVALFYVLLLALVFVFKKKYIETLVSNVVIKVFFDKSDDE